MTKKDNDTDDMIGFKDFAETDSQFMKNKNQSKRDTSNGHELLTFLERESTRLSKIINLCEEKSFNLKRFPQSDKIHELAQEELEILQNDIRQRLMAKDSVFTINLDEILQSHFNS
jgi:hypothetical protein